MERKMLGSVRYLFTREAYNSIRYRELIRDELWRKIEKLIDIAESKGDWNTITIEAIIPYKSLS